MGKTQLWKMDDSGVFSLSNWGTGEVKGSLTTDYY